jgi:hypothetical protein
MNKAPVDYEDAAAFLLVLAAWAAIALPIGFLSTWGGFADRLVISSPFAVIQATIKLRTRSAATWTPIAIWSSVLHALLALPAAILLFTFINAVIVFFYLVGSVVLMMVQALAADGLANRFCDRAPGPTENPVVTP